MSRTNSRDPLRGSDEIRAVISRYFDAINAEDWTALRAVFHPDAMVIAVGVPPRRGVDEIMAFYQKLFAAWTKHDDSPTRFLVEGDAAAVEVRFTGTTHDGRVLGFDAVDIIDVREDQIARLTNWYDLVHVRRMLAADHTKEQR